MQGVVVRGDAGRVLSQHSQGVRTRATTRARVRCRRGIKSLVFGLAPSQPSLRVSVRALQLQPNTRFARAPGHVCAVGGASNRQFFIM